MLAILIALAHIVITGPPPPGLPPATEKGILSSYDYPAEAVRERSEGTVVVDVLVGVDGSPKSCSITKSSGHKSLDLTTCNVIMSRAKFTAKKDEAGKAIEGHFGPLTVEWRLKK